MDNALSRYYDGIKAAVEELRNTRSLGSTEWFQPGWDLPEPSEQLERFFAAAELSGGSLGEYRGRPLWFLNMTENPRTRTTKTFGSLLIVARALQHTAATGEPVLLLTPSAANKAVALRDAVLRAYETGLATPETLRVTVVVPSSSLPKLWDSPMLANPAYAAANPIGVFDGSEREDVKKLATGAVGLVAEEIRQATGFRVWYTLDPNNYMVADVVRAYYERDALTPGERTRWHTHAVSSAYGFLGHDLGRRLAKRDGSWTATGHARYLFVQHLETPDLVTGLRFGESTEHALPDYEFDSDTGLMKQAGQTDPRFPSVCYSTEERLERTFYTRRPPTIPRVQELVTRQGGDGIVVSLHECLQRYQEVRHLLAKGGMTRLPEDPRKLREFAMVMSTVGALTAIDRGLVPEDEEILIHGSGAYSEGEFHSPDRCNLTPVAVPEDVAALLREAAKA
ncbi:DUF6002 family protein [Streptomyces sp. YGL11-2]|uniref:DUF6002 family protein n=1 Tax=Streptomyces sp. YGL11-2 TaxID=3414028 RepID=UPI003CF52F1B